MSRRTSRATGAAAALLAVLFSPPLSRASAPATGATDTAANDFFVFRWHWEEGIEYDVELQFDDYWFGPDEGLLGPFEKRLAFIGKIGARVQVDTAGYVETRGLQDADSGIELRRLRVGTRGDFYLLRHVSYAVDLELVQSRLQIGDIYLWWRGVPWVDRLKIGNFTPPMSLESMTGSRDSVFMEYGLPVEAFAPGRSSGIQIGGPVLGQRVTWALGGFRTIQTETVGDQSQAGGRVIGRLTWLVEDARVQPRLIHLGVSASRLFGAEDVRYRSHPESHLAPTFVDTGAIRAAEQSTVSGLEFARIRGPWLVMSETLLAHVQGRDSSWLWGIYGSVGRFLSSGDSQPYHRGAGILGRFEPSSPFSWANGTWGAFMVAGRVSHLDLSDGRVRGGRETNVTADLTWFLNHYILCKLEYGFAAIRDRPDDGDLHFVQARFQLDFF